MVGAGAQAELYSGMDYYNSKDSVIVKSSLQNQKTDSQKAEESQQENKQLSIITQEKMQQQQYEKFKKLYESVKQQHKEIIILK